MGLGETCSKAIIILINTIFMPVGLLFIAIGAIILAAKDIIKNVGFNFTDSLQGLLTSIGTNQTEAVQEAEDAIDGMLDFLKEFGIVILVIGLVIFLLTILGCCGSCCVVKCMLIGYVVLVSIILIAEAVCIGLYATGKLDEPIKDELTETLQDKFTGNFGMDVDTLAINALQVYVGCCGINNWMDYQNVTNWNRSEGFVFGNVSYDATVVVPTTCCRLTGDFPSDFTLEDDECPIKPTPTNSYMEDGCYDEVKEMLSTYESIVLGVTGGSLGLELLVILLAVLLLCSSKDKEKDYY